MQNNKRRIGNRSSLRPRVTNLENEDGKRTGKPVPPIVVTVVACGEEGREQLKQMDAAGYQQGAVLDAPAALVAKRFLTPAEIVSVLKRQPHKMNGHSNGEMTHE